MAAARSGRRTIRGGDTSEADSGPTRPPFVFRHPSPSRPAARLFGLSLIPFPSRLFFTNSFGLPGAAGRPSDRFILSLPAMVWLRAQYWPMVDRILNFNFSFLSLSSPSMLQSGTACKEVESVEPLNSENYYFAFAYCPVYYFSSLFSFSHIMF